MAKRLPPNRIVSCGNHSRLPPASTIKLWCIFDVCPADLYTLADAGVVINADASSATETSI